MRICFFVLAVMVCGVLQANERWYQDNNLGVNGGAPHDFIDRLNRLYEWEDSRDVMHVFYLRYATYRDYLQGNSGLMSELAGVLNTHNVVVALDDTAAVWAHSDIKNKDTSYTASINTLNSLLAHGFDVKYVGLQSVLSKPLYDANGVEHHYPMSTRYKDVSVYFDKVRPHFPDIQIGIIDALPAKVSVGSYQGAYSGLIDHLAGKGHELDFLHLDLPMSYPRKGKNGLSFSKLVDVGRYVKNTLNIPFGLFVVDDEGGKASSSSFSYYALDGLDRFLKAGGAAEAYVLSAWYPYPDYSVPDRITMNPPTGLSIFRNMDQLLSFHGLENTKACFYDVRRTFSGGNHDVMYPGYRGAGSLEGVVFRTSCDLTTEKKALYNCTTNGFNTFVSEKVNCEGHSARSPSFIGYVYKSAGENRRPIYRCRVGGNHFVTKNYEECSRYIVGGVLGYTE